MREVGKGLWVGDLEDCGRVHVGGIDVIHACKYPCYHERFGRTKSTDPRYLSVTEGEHLYLNMIDPREPVFPIDLFRAFLTFIHRPERGKESLIHCNAGMSRSPSLAMLVLASRGEIPADFEGAEAAYRSRDDGYAPSGIREWLVANWGELLAVER